MSRYGERLRELRAERQLSLREVEERGGPSKDTMSLTERGVHRPHPRTLGKIAQALGMSVSALQAELEGADSPKAPMTSVEEVLDAADAATQWAALSDEEWEAELENTEDPRELLRSVEAERMATQDLRHRLGQSGQHAERQLAGRMIMRYLTRAAQAARRAVDPEAVGKIEEMLAGVQA